MLIYEYQCTQCGERFEVRQSMGEDGSKLHCPKCTTTNPERVVSSFFTPGGAVPGPTELNLADRTEYMKESGMIPATPATSKARPITRGHPTWLHPQEVIREFNKKSK